MVNYLFKRNIFRIREMAFGSFVDTKTAGSDIVYMHSNDSEFEDISSECIVKKQYTLFNNLLLEEQDILSKIKKNCRYEIRRAERENVLFRFYDSRDLQKNTNVIIDFQKIYNNMFQIKGIKSYSFNTNLVLAGINAANIVITMCSDKNDESLVVFHAYLCDGDSCVLLYSASPVWEKKDKEKISAIGRMNKYLHWKDILSFKERGYSRYEWGGITDVENPNGIDRFKMEFGGEVQIYYNYIVANSLKGRLYLYLLKWREKKMRKIIINADDFGISHEVNHAVVYCFKNKMINQTTLLVNMDFTMEAVSLAKKNGFGNQVGLHLNLIEGVPLTKRIRTTHLCGENGEFNGNIMKDKKNRFFIDRYTQKCVAEEIEAQIKKYIELDIGVKHIDSHQHSHINPSIFRILLPILKKYRFESIRLARNIPVSSISKVKRYYKNYINRKIIRFNDEYSPREKIILFGSMSDVNKEEDIVTSLEMMVHPILINNLLKDAFCEEKLDIWWDINREKYILIDNSRKLVLKDAE